MSYPPYVPPPYDHGNYHPQQESRHFPLDPDREPPAKLSRGETTFHLIATVCTAGLWGFVWRARINHVRR